MAELLSGHTSMRVLQATDGMLIAQDHLYIIPPGSYLSMADGALRVSQPQARHGARLPVDFFLNSLAIEYGARAVCVILSGTGADGSLGAVAVKERGGLVIAQDPDEAAFDGMPRAAIATGKVDLILQVARIPEALSSYDPRAAVAQGLKNASAPARNSVREIIDILRARTKHDFTQYKIGTLQRRVDRRMAMVGIGAQDVDRYLDVLRGNSSEVDLLANDMLINVTSFFRDKSVFDFLAEKIIPELVHSPTRAQPLRVWVVGCSTGEETYSLAMLFREQISSFDADVKLQIFASDVDADAVATAREGLYSGSIAGEVSPARLSRFFMKEDSGYRILPDLRASVVFTVQDVLADPPFSRLDMVSCRNMLIYLRPEAQENVLALFHFALRDGGILLLGGSETPGNIAGRFQVISKPGRIYRHIGRSDPREIRLPPIGAIATTASLKGLQRESARPVDFVEICRQQLVERYAPAAVLINRARECLYFFGATDAYLVVSPGLPVRDVIAMARERVRAPLRSAVQQAGQAQARVVVSGGRLVQEGVARSFSVAVEPVPGASEELLLICFLAEPAPRVSRGKLTAPKESSRLEELERELEGKRVELRAAIHDLEVSEEEQKAVNAEAMSANEEFQSTNEELLTSKEELQSLNEELTALNSQLHETLERQRTTSNDLQNVLYSTNVATLFLDTDLNIRFFTPATKLLFNVIPGDVGRPLSDLNSLAIDASLLDDARTVLHTLETVEREIEIRRGEHYIRRILPYRKQDDSVEGVVITFANVSQMRQSAEALEKAERHAQLANAAKSRFLAAASHDLRQPLQTLTFILATLPRRIAEHKHEDALALVEKLAATANSMSSMLNALLDINEIEAGGVRVEPVRFQVDDLLGRLRDEFGYLAQAQGLTLRGAPCGLSVYSDPRLLEQMIRNLLSNALKYTNRGKLLLGCRRRGEMVSIEIWDAGIGIPERELQAIFEEYHQIDNPARERSRGLGLGLSIVKRLGILLGHPVRVRSQLGKGSVFSIEVKRAASTAPPLELNLGRTEYIVVGEPRTGAILVIEDDPDVREFIEAVLSEAGHHVRTAPDGISALRLVASAGFQPDLILTDLNLPSAMDGLQVIAKVRDELHRQVPAVILTGDISSGSLHRISLQNCERLRKPVKPQELTKEIQRLLSPSASQSSAQPPPHGDLPSSPRTPVMFVVDDDSQVQAALRNVLGDEGWAVEAYDSSEMFLKAYVAGTKGCLLVDAVMPGMDGFSLLQHMKDRNIRLPAIMITGNGDVHMAVRAMQAGASDFIQKPFDKTELLASIGHALEQTENASQRFAGREAAAKLLARLTLRQREIMELVLAGRPSKNIAADLGVSQRTVENHRAAIMRKTGSKSFPELVRLAISAASNNDGEQFVRR
jgi:two-component system, chemotaxis family, CheB/CheR fusion protein